MLLVNIENRSGIRKTSKETAAVLTGDHGWGQAGKDGGGEKQTDANSTGG